MSDENYTFQDNSSLHKYRTETPNIIYDLNLDPFQGWLYSHLKRIAGDSGNCFASNKTLATLAGMSETKIKDCKKELARKGLIKIKVRKNLDKSNATTLIEIVDMWPANWKHFEKKYSRIHDDLHQAGGDRYQAHKNRYQAGGDRKEEPTKERTKEEYKENIQKKGKAKASPSPLALKMLAAFSNTIKKNSPEITREVKPDEAKHFDKLLKQGYSEEEILKCIEFALTDSFWQPHVTTPYYFRLKFEKFLLALKRKMNMKNDSPVARNKSSSIHVSQNWDEEEKEYQKQMKEYKEKNKEVI